MVGKDVVFIAGIFCLCIGIISSKDRWGDFDVDALFDDVRRADYKLKSDDSGIDYEDEEEYKEYEEYDDEEPSKDVVGFLDDFASQQEKELESKGKDYSYNRYKKKKNLDWDKFFEEELAQLQKEIPDRSKFFHAQDEWIQTSPEADKLMGESQLMLKLSEKMEKEMNCKGSKCRKEILEDVEDFLSTAAHGGSDYSDYKISSRRKRVLLPEGFQAQFCERKERKCPSNDRYPSLDGWCNNKKHPEWGGAITPFNRIMPPNYRDDILEPHSVEDDYPNPFLISEELLSDGIRDFTRDDRRLHHESLSVLFMQWGQFLAHDIAQGSFFHMDYPDCLDRSTFAQLRCRNVRYQGREWPFAISNKVDTSFCDSKGKVRFSPVNGFSSFIDGTQVYGIVSREKGSNRLFRSGQIKTLRKTTNNCGDSRCAVSPLLMSMHELFRLEHNRIATALQRAGIADDQILYQEARRIVIAELQSITYQEWLPIVLGDKYMTKHDLYINKKTKYNDKVNPSLMVEFQSAAMRFGHSLVPGIVNFRGPNRHSLNASLFDIDHKMELPQLMLGGMASPCHKVDMVITSQLKDLPKAFLMPDLVALNIQRGRDHGLPSWGDMRKKLKKKLSGNKDLHRDVNYKRIQRVYRPIDWKDADLYVGGLAERHVQGGQVGFTVATLLGDQFRRLKDGDRYFFTHSNGDGLPPSIARPLRNRKLSHIICDNFPQLGQVNLNAFRMLSVKLNCRSSYNKVPIRAIVNNFRDFRRFGDRRDEKKERKRSKEKSKSKEKGKGRKRKGKGKGKKKRRS